MSVRIAIIPVAIWGIIVTVRIPPVNVGIGPSPSVIIPSIRIGGIVVRIVVRGDVRRGGLRPVNDGGRGGTGGGCHSDLTWRLGSQVAPVIENGLDNFVGSAAFLEFDDIVGGRLISDRGSFDEGDHNPRVDFGVDQLGDFGEAGRVLRCGPNGLENFASIFLSLSHCCL
jgi:hypothetical protein